ncbi:hypothetical protein ILYODFUR_032936 [Ilyodon furcidens]|uniref:Uncharacterized protein n=1 Tax=Ilyodon furcidens TaxID=33524 RepID=A0ABV0V9S4_9TELE
MPEPPQLAPLNVEEHLLYSEPLPDGRAAHPISKGVPGNPTEETHFSRLYPGSHSFGRDPKFMAIDEGRNVDRPVQISLHHNGPAQCPLELASRTTSSAKRRDEIHWSPNQTPSGPWLSLEILSIKVMNSTGDKGQACQSPTCTGIRSDLVLAMQTKLLLRLYRDQMAPKKGPPIPYSWSTPHRAP